MSQEKIKELDELAVVLDSLREERRIVLCHGVFDLLHIGHIKHFEQAREHGDVLVVTLTQDRYVNKGPHRPAFSQDLRAEMIASLACVDYVAINRWPTSVETVKLLKPHAYVKGSDYADPADDRSGKIVEERQAVESVGGRIVFTGGVTFSSTQLINRYLPIFPEEVSQFLDGFSQRHSTDEVIGYLERARDLKALVLGEAIIDEYCSCETMGKSGKEPVLAARYVSEEKFAGGALAVANHVASFCQGVGLLTFLGLAETQEEFIRQRLNRAVEADFLYHEDAPTIVKRRFVETYPFQKLFEFYIMGESEVDEEAQAALCARLEKILPDFDLVIVADYGHGMIGPEAVRVLAEKARFLAVNTQVNAGNHGFNTVSKYPRADFVSVSEKEIRLEVRDRRADLKRIVSDVSRRLSVDRVLITQGEKGCLCYDGQEGFFEAPALASRVVDRIGAGDAVFAVTALLAAQSAPAEIIGLVGNAVGAQAVRTVANREPIDRLALVKHIDSLLK